VTAQDKINEAVGKVHAKSSSISEALTKATDNIERRLPQFLPPGTAQRFVSIALSTVGATSILRECTEASIVRGVMRAAEFGLAIDGVLGHAYLVPYRIKGVQTAQFQIGYRGLVELAYRTGQWQSVSAKVVCENDSFEYAEGTAPKIEHVRKLGDRGNMVAVYAIAWPKEGTVPTFVILDEDDVMVHRKSSKAFARNPKQSIWETHPKVAWRKSAVRELSKELSMTGEHHESIRRAAVLDEQIDSGETIDVEAEVIESEGE
jgi:recombination protein RecT